jgi:hypothetical protein
VGRHQESPLVSLAQAGQQLINQDSLGQRKAVLQGQNYDHPSRTAADGQGGAQDKA